MKVCFFVFICSFASVLFGDNRIYVTNNQGTNSSSISIVDINPTTGAGTVTGYVQNPLNFNLIHPVDSEVVPNTTKGYIVCDQANAVYVLDLTNNIIVSSVSSILGPFNAPIVVLAPTNLKAYVTNEGNNSVSIIDTVTDTVSGTVITGAFPFNLPIGLACSSDGTIAYVANYNGPNISIIDVATNTVTGYVNPGAFSLTNPLLIAFKNNTKAYVSDFNGKTVFVIDVTTGTITGTVSNLFTPFAGPVNVVVSNDLTTLYITDILNNTVYIADTTTDTVTGTISGTFNGPLGLIEDSSVHRIYIANSTGNNVSIIDDATDTQVGTVDPATFPFRAPYQLQLLFAVPPVPPPPPVFVVQPPGSIISFKKKSIFASQTDLINEIQWSTPTSGNPPVEYLVFRDTLSQLIGVVPASDRLQFSDHNRKKHSITTYYVISVDKNGNQSQPASITVSQ